MCDSTREGLKKLREKISLPHSDGKNIYQKQKVYDFFTRDQIKGLGDCRCKKNGCCFHASEANPSRVFTEEIILQIRKGFTSALALLVYSGDNFGTIIFEFIEKGFSDERLTETPLTDEEWAQIISNTTDRPRYSIFDSQAILELQHEFFLPQLSFLSPHYSTPQARLLPFTVGNKIGSGTYSTVYDATIFPGYHDFPDIKDGRVALKVYTRKEKIDCEKERESNKRCSHPYIMPLQASLDRYEIYMAIYPLAKQDLRKLLKSEPPAKYFEDPKSVWERFVNLLSALNHIHSSQDGSFGYHFDIKPHNILVRFNDDWAITDLGLAHWKAIGNGGSETTKRGGNERYRAPEDRPHRNYDVWAMGCIGCEIIAWLNKGAGKADRVENFRIEREEDCRRKGGRCILDNFHHGKELKESVTGLLDRAFNEGGFSAKVAKILRKMLEIDPGKRLKASEAEGLFREILGMGPAPKIENTTSTHAVVSQQTLGVGNIQRRGSIRKYSDASKDDTLKLELPNANANLNVPTIKITAEAEDLHLLAPEVIVTKPKNNAGVKRPLPESFTRDEDRSTQVKRPFKRQPWVDSKNTTIKRRRTH